MASPIRHIAHLDLDCFFVSVERIKDPGLRGKPVAVGGSPRGRGVIASASYEARAFGVRSAMPTAHALRLCTHLTVVPGHHHLYDEYSDGILHRLQSIAPVVERASIDEMYLDFTGCETLYGNDLPGFMTTLQNLVLAEFSLPCTIALAANKTVAKIATGTAKPAGVRIVPAGTERDFLAPLPVDVVPGVGPKTEELLKRKGLHTIADLQRAGRNRLTEIVGSLGVWLHRVAEGGGNDRVEAEQVRKSVSREETFARDIIHTRELERILFTLVEDVGSTLRKKRLKGRSVTIKIRDAAFHTITRATTVPPSYDDHVIFNASRELLKRHHADGRPVRLIGVQVSDLRAADELTLFPADGRRDQILQTIESLREKFGRDVIHLGDA